MIWNKSYIKRQIEKTREKLLIKILESEIRQGEKIDKLEQRALDENSDIEIVHQKIDGIHFLLNKSKETKKDIDDKILELKKEQSITTKEYIPNIYKRLNTLEDNINNLLFLDKKVDDHRRLVHQYLFLLWLVAGLSIVLAILVIKFIPIP